MTEQPYYGPDASAKDIFLERTFVAGDVVTGTGYGIQLVLFTTCAKYLWEKIKVSKRSNTSSKSSAFLLAYMVVLMIIETIYVAVQARTVQDMYIDNRNYPGGPWEYFLATQNKAINVMFYATLFLVTLLSDMLVLWRCWVIWGASGSRRLAYAAVALPFLMFLASFVMGTLWTLQSSQPGLSLYSALPRAYGMSYFFISLGVNIVVTVLIVFRLLMYRRTILKHLPEEHTKRYSGLVAIVVESAAVYSVFAVLFIITYSVDNPINQICLSLASSSQQIAGYWIIYRTAQGRAWTKHTLAQVTTNTSDINFRVTTAGESVQVSETRHGNTTTTPFESELTLSEKKPSPKVVA
ncbi:hypothetical protein CC2G_000319 [Coprinopsis cinerea AmutBmut pab1-1]|nr:hypothetical protein CC2G_000319 [Coprinopsis cinerea AmutBmut pab1-1]